MKSGFQTTLRDRVTDQRRWGPFGNACSTRPSSRRRRFGHRLPAHRAAGRARAADRGQMVERYPDRALHGARRCLRAPASARSNTCWPRSSGLQIDNVLIEIDGPETPIMDGSAADFVSAIDQVGIVQQSRPRRYLKILKPVRVERDGGFAEFRPADRGFRLDVEIDFDRRRSAASAALSISTPATFRSEIARARTFGFVSDVKKLWKAGFALGSSLDNSVALDGDAILNPEGPALCGRIRPPQGARRGRRPFAGRRADHRPLPHLSAGPQDERDGAGGAVRRAVRPMNSSKRRGARSSAKGVRRGTRMFRPAAAAFAAAD